MNKRLIFILAIIIALIMVGLGVGGCWQKNGGEKEMAGNDTKVTETTTQEWKTYISKYGFSVKYPTDWYLREPRDIKPTEEWLNGYKPFEITDYYPEDPKMTPKSKGIRIEFLFLDQIVKSRQFDTLPSDAFKKLIFLAKKHNIYVGEENERKQLVVNGINMSLIYFDGIRLRKALFYLPAEDTIVEVVRYSEYGENEFLSIIKTIKLLK